MRVPAPPPPEDDDDDAEGVKGGGDVVVDVDVAPAAKGVDVGGVVVILMSGGTLPG